MCRQLFISRAFWLIVTEYDTMNKIKTASRVFAFTAIIGLTALLALSSLSFTSAASYNNVQIFIQTTSNLPDYFTVSAFNTSGYMVASSQTQYPAASIELPNGQYIFTVTADRTNNQIYYSPLPMGGVNVAQGNLAMPYYIAPVVEYGYSVQQISSSTTLTISTQNVTSIPTTTLTVKVTYANGTAAEGASVSASVVGSWYYWGYESNAVMWTTTQADGVATLVTPQAPVQVNAWSWLPVNLPENQTTVAVVIAGEEVNVTVYWQPMYVGLAGSALIIPPQTSASITLHVQHPDYWVMPYGVKGTPTVGGTATAASGPGSIPTTVYQQQQGNPVLQNSPPPTTQPLTTPPISQPTSPSDSGLFSGSNLAPTIVAFAALAVAAASLLVAARTKRHKPVSDS
jgi:hypothetical protein